MSPRINFDAVNAAALASLPSLLGRWFPAGKQRGHEFVIGNLRGDPGESLSINVNTGLWADFAADLRGGDPISLYAAVHGMAQGEAARALAGELGVTVGVEERSTGNNRAEKPAAKAPVAEWEPILPVPGDASAATFRHGKHGEPSRTWPYADADGQLLGYVCRFDKAEGHKEVMPRVFARCTKAGWSYRKRDGAGGGQHRVGDTGWQWLSFPKPRPLYGLAELAARPRASVVLVEGEKAADAARKLLAGVVVVTWPGGGKAVKHVDWSPLAGRKVAIWPDADEPGAAAAREITAALEGVAAGVRWLQVPADVPDGWDAADATWSPDEAMAYLREHLVEPPVPAADEPPVHVLDEYPDAPPETDAEDPVRPLGYNHAVYYYRARGTRQVHEITAAGHTKNALLALAPLHYWQRTFPGGKAGADWDMAANALMRRCERAGVYDPARIRGRGAWYDNGRAVLHLGDQLIVDGAPAALETVESGYVYEAAAPMRINFALDPLPSREAVSLRELCEMLPWERPISAVLLAGFCVVAPICGALTWRPHIYVTGGAGAGKSWLMDHIVRRCLGDTALAVQSETTEAGLRQTLGHDALPVVFDEAEGEDQRAQARIQNVMALMRQASSETGAAIIKGSANGRSMSYRIRSCFAFASIGVNVQQHADMTRVSILSLRENRSATRRQDFERLCQFWVETLTEDFVQRLQARSITLIPTIRRNAEVFSAAGAQVLGTQRLGDQVGALLAGAYSLSRSDVITHDAAVRWLNEQDWADETAVREQRDEQLLLSHLMEHTVRVQLDRSAMDRSLGELVGVAAWKVSDPDIGDRDANATLLRVGMKVDGDTLLISNTASAIARVLGSTPWSRNWGRILARLDGAEATNPLRFGPGAMSRAVRVPLAAVLD